MLHQSKEAQKGEIRFRRRLFRHQVGGERLFDDEYDAAAMDRILAERMAKTRKDISALKGGGAAISPYLEIGAERCQRSLVMQNDFGADGAAADISYDMLNSCGHYMSVFGKRRAPLRVCCDANNLPFLPGSMPFVFCYQTLHHFPDPGPVIAEVMRVLSPGGRFLIEEEPFRKILHLGLYKSRKIHSSPGPSGRFSEILDFFFSETNCNETGYGVIENERISLGQWKRALSGFAEKRITLRTVKGLETELFSPPGPLGLLAWLFGGGIRGVCRKEGAPPSSYPPVSEALACPECREKGLDAGLSFRGGGVRCSACSASFPEDNGVLFLFSSEKFNELYPDIFARTKTLS